jgi:guanine deaminase
LRELQIGDKADELQGTLREWVENYTDPIEESYKDSVKAKRVYTEMVKKELEIGTTTCAYNSSIHPEATNILADICLEYGQRAIIGKLCILQGSTHGNFEVSTEQSLEDTQKSLDHMKKIDPKEDIVMPCVQPRGGPYVPPKLMAGLGEKSQANGSEKIRVQAHMCETTSDLERTLELHPGFSNYSEVYKHYGMLHEKSILAHCIHLSDRDIELLVETGAGVAHNPNSNTCLRDGECKVRQLLNAGVKVGLGTGNKLFTDH